MERKIAMSNTTNEQDRKEFSFEENFIDETIIADKSSKTKEFIKKFMKRKTAVAGFIVIVFRRINGNICVFAIFPYIYRDGKIYVLLTWKTIVIYKYFHQFHFIRFGERG